MTDHRIESLRQNAALLTDCGYTTAAGVLLREADRIEREQSDEKRIDTLARVFLRAEDEVAEYGLTPWFEQHENQRSAYRAGIRAVLARLDQDETLADGIIEGFARQDDGYSDQPFGKDGHFRRQWGDLRLIPDDVTEVVASNKHRATRNPEATYGWQWKHSGSPLATTGALAPYIEIVGGDQ